MPRVAALLFVTVGVLSGSAYLAIAVAVQDVPPVLVSCVRALLGSAVLLPLAARRGLLRGWRGRARQLATLGALEFALPFVLVSTGSQWLASGLVGVLMAAGPLLVVALSARLGAAEPVTPTQAGGLVVGMGGVVLLLGVSVAGKPSELLGVALVLAGSTSLALGALYFRRTFSDAPALGTVAGAMAAGAALLLLPALATLPRLDGAPSARSLVALGVLGTVHSALNYSLFFVLVGAVGAARASVTSYVAPAVAVLFGVVFLGEAAGGGLVAGLLLVLLGSWLGTGGALPPGARPSVVLRRLFPRRPVTDEARPVPPRPRRASGGRPGAAQRFA